MCTLTVVTRNHAYLVAMNRDEKIARGTGFPPKIHEFEGTKAIYPSDGDGGTWFATNDYGITLALLNWNTVAPHGMDPKTRSRGSVISALIDSQSQSDLEKLFDVSAFKGMMPFRLVGVFPSEHTIWEWLWDSRKIRSQAHKWESRHWFSSSLSDRQAESLRGVVCRDAQNEPDAGSAPWLRRLHASHTGGPGPFSLCVHREDMKTLSYTEVMVAAGYIKMRHFRGSPCALDKFHSIVIHRGDCPDPDVMGLSGPAI
jgi:hypothetical protein